MKEKIIEKIFEELSTNFKFEYPPLMWREEFEKQSNTVSELAYKKIAALKVEYDSIINSPDDNIFFPMVKFTKESYVNQFKNKGIFNINNGYTHEIKEKLKKENKEIELKKGEEYDSILKERLNLSKVTIDLGYSKVADYIDKEKWLISFYEFFKSKKDEFTIDIENDISTFFLSRIPLDNITEQTVDDSESFFRLCKSIKVNYEEKQGKYMNILETSKKYLERENIQSMADWIVNIGHRRFFDAGGGGLYSRKILANEYRVLSGGQEYRFVQKNDCKEIEDVFANVFVLSGNRLLKLSIGSKTLHQRTEYLISKDIQKVSIAEGNIVEVHMHKHFDPETIVFDTEDAAYEFQDKINKLRDGRGNY